MSLWFKELSSGESQLEVLQRYILCVDVRGRYLLRVISITRSRIRIRMIGKVQLLGQTRVSSQINY
jgi:hypothetical protein